MTIRAAIIMGSKSDAEQVQPAVDLLKELKIGCRVDVASAHRTPDKVEQIMKDAVEQGVQVFICAAGHAAHLAGVVAARSPVPVIGIPIASSDLDGMDSILSTVMMPPGVPVATMALGKAGAKNAAVLAAQIIGISDASVAQRLSDWRAHMGDQVAAEPTQVWEVD